MIITKMSKFLIFIFVINFFQFDYMLITMNLINGCSISKRGDKFWHIQKVVNDIMSELVSCQKL